MLVLDASVVFDAVQFRDGFALFADEELAAPPLMWSEVRSVLREHVWRGELKAAAGRAALERLEEAPVTRRVHPRLGREAWRIAEEMGWARTYDAEYVGLALLLKCRLVTYDARLRRATQGLGFVIGPADI